MLQQNEVDDEWKSIAFAESPPRPFDRGRWEVIVNRVIDELAKGGEATLKSISSGIGFELGTLEIWLKSPTCFLSYGRRVGEKSTSEKIGEALEKYFLQLEEAGANVRMRCPVRVKTGVIAEMVSGIEAARSMCEFVEICAAPGLGKTESTLEYIASCRKAEGFDCPVWLIELDESCISVKAVLQLIARQVVRHGQYDPKSEFSMVQAIIEATTGRRGLLLVDEGQHLADAQKIMGIPIINMLRRFVDRGLFGIAYFGNGEIYRRLISGTGKDKGAYTQLLSRMQDFRVEIHGLGKGGDGAAALTREDVLAVAATWGVTGIEERAYCLKVAAQPGALRTMTNVFRRSLERFGHIDITTMTKIRRV